MDIGLYGNLIYNETFTPKQWGGNSLIDHERKMLWKKIKLDLELPYIKVEVRWINNLQVKKIIKDNIENPVNLKWREKKTV